MNRNKHGRMSVQEWFMCLPEPFKTKALENMEGKNKFKVTESIENALLYGFPWAVSNEGYVYWSMFYMDVTENNITLSSGFNEEDKRFLEELKMI